jgi:hypothetical protein
MGRREGKKSKERIEKHKITTLNRQASSITTTKVRTMNGRIGE